MSKIKIILSIYGDLLDSQYFSDLIKISPTSFWTKGDIIPNRKKNITRKENCWEYSTGLIETLSLEEITCEFIEKFNPFISVISDYLTKNNLEAKIDLVVEITNKEIPSLFFSKEFINIVFKLRGELDFDLYFLEAPSHEQNENKKGDH